MINFNKGFAYMGKGEIILYQPDDTAAVKPSKAGAYRYVKTTEQNGRTIFMRYGANDKSAKLTLIDVSKIVNEDGSPVDLKSASKLRWWLIKNYDGKKVEVKDNGETIRFAKEELRASTKRRGDEQRQVYSELDKLLENSIYYGYEQGDTRHQRVDRQDIYYSAAKIDDSIFGIRFKVDIHKKDGNGVYKDHKVAKIEDVEEIDIKKPPSPYHGTKSGGIEGGRNLPTPYAGVSPTGTEGRQTVSVSKIREAMSLPNTSAPVPKPHCNNIAQKHLAVNN